MTIVLPAAITKPLFFSKPTETNAADKTFRHDENTPLKHQKKQTATAPDPLKPKFCINRVLKKILSKVFLHTEKFCLRQNGIFNSD